MWTRRILWKVREIITKFNPSYLLIPSDLNLNTFIVSLLVELLPLFPYRDVRIQKNVPIADEYEAFPNVELGR